MRLDDYTKENKKKELERGLGSLIAICPVCGREFSCNKAYHVYTALMGRKRYYYCSYTCYNKRPMEKKKRRTGYTDEYDAD